MIADDSWHLHMWKIKSLEDCYKLTRDSKEYVWNGTQDNYFDLGQILNLKNTRNLDLFQQMFRIFQNHL